jgi:LPS sulfotransferase NodH
MPGKSHAVGVSFKELTMRPHTSYLVCATPRSGSFLLCEALKNTALAGQPEEYFWRDDEPAWKERWGYQTSLLKKSK